MKGRRFDGLVAVKRRRTHDGGQANFGNDLVARPFDSRDFKVSHRLEEHVPPNTQRTSQQQHHSETA